MQLEEIYLYGFQRFKMEIVRSFYWTPKSKLGLIISGNGAGKSRLLNEISPMPANKSDFITGGIKRTIWSLDNVKFKLTSDFTKGQLHSFKRIIDGIETELNEGGTITIQKELVKQYLNYDSKIHELLTGQLRFTEMLPGQRKELMMEICPMDLSYANKLYDDLRIMSRDDQGALKHQLAKCSELEFKLSAIDVVDDEDTVKYLEGMVERLLPFKGNSNIDLEDLWNTISSLITNIETNGDKWKLWKSDIRLPANIRNINDLNMELGRLEGSKQSSKIQLNELNKKVMELNSVLDQLDGNTLSKEQITERLKVIDYELGKFKVYDFSKLVYNPNAIGKINYIATEIENCIPVDKVNIFNNEEIDRIEDLYLSLNSKLANTKQRLNTETDKLNHLKEDSQSVVCYKCQTKLTMFGTNIESEIAKLESIVLKGNEFKEKLEKEIEAILPTKQEMSTYIQIRDRLSMLSRKDISFNTFFINSGWTVDKVILNLSGFLTDVQKYNFTISQYESYNSLVKEKDSYVLALKKFELLGDDFFNNQSKIEKQIEESVIYQRELDDQIQYLSKAKKMYEYFLQITDRCELLLTKLLETFKEYIDASIRIDAKQRIDELYSKLGSIKHMVNQKTVLKQAILDSHNDIDLLKERQSNLDILVNIMSPTKGIVADQMTGFINSYVEQINKVLEQIWEQTLEVLPCSLENGGLDYKFPINAEGQPVPDISMGSSGMRDIIDLGFILVMRQYLNLVDYPLFMDETGATFDSSHRTNLLKFIKVLIDTQQCQQIFMVNHYADWHGGLSNYETAVLDKRNIVVPSVYNQNVKINENV